MSVTQLYPGNFKLVGNANKTLNINLPGVVLVFFKLRECQGCHLFEPVFMKLASEERSINYAICDLSASKEVIKMSQSTKTPLVKVPQIFLYVNGRPHARFRGDKNVPSLRSFISKAMSQTPQQSNVYQQGGMYSGYHQQQFQQPQQFNNSQSRENYYTPELDQSFAKMRNRANNDYSIGGYVEDDHSSGMIMPDNVTPHNEPWNNSYKKFDS